MPTEEQLNGMEESFQKALQEAADKHPDIAILLSGYNKISKQEGKWTSEFLNGYLACISDLTIIKKML